MRIVFINDDEGERKLWLAWAERKGHKAWAVETAFDAFKIAADYYVFDISAVAGCAMTNLHWVYSPICTMVDLHPGSTIVIVSGISEQDVMSVIEEVEEKSGHRPLYGGCGSFDEFEKLIEM